VLNQEFALLIYRVLTQDKVYFVGRLRGVAGETPALPATR
jgi:hypothetical protein